ncbi:aldo/keto reductase [Dactylosporangium matsuzakiense]|uniref:Oxidoreductase n=1 Tax=Dactylosporangium matsuzakiense TaxID=53360 RepID=A0A9W6KPI9_9ACTN|nr:aldo/keto reductase [Dactylosporangium matsuzakiense]UWZ42005.1 aldo/keto reductase [Dactylosporangium matsuzakiense]GLL04912.1 oxidoreductase [Dactylosporangium matsuzakiense]
MQYTNLGRSGLRVSRLCLGTMNFGWQIGEAESHAILDGALAEGINFIDTADMYGARDYEGTAEQYIGSWFAASGKRDAVVLATKVYQPMGDGPNDRGLSARHIVAACEASLRRLGTDRIDLYQMHHVDRGTPWEEIWQAMDRLVAQGKVLYVGSSNFAGWHLAGAQAAAMKRHSLGLVSEQLKYSLLTRHVELEVVPAAQALGIGLLPWSPLAQGLLSGALRKHRDGAAGRSTSHAAARVAEHREVLERYEAFCDDLGLEPAAVALAWLLARPGVTAPVIGPRTVGQLDVPLRALETTLSDDAERRLEELFPPVGNGGPGPEAWAW